MGCGDRCDDPPLATIMLTAAAASLGMIPIASEVFWGPMAYAVIGGLFVATMLTLLFLPALHVAWFRIKEPRKEPQPGLGVGVPAGLSRDNPNSARNTAAIANIETL